MFKNDHVFFSLFSFLNHVLGIDSRMFFHTVLTRVIIPSEKPFRVSFFVFTVYSKNLYYIHDTEFHERFIVRHVPWTLETYMYACSRVTCITDNENEVGDSDPMNRKNILKTFESSGI